MKLTFEAENSNVYIEISEKIRCENFMTRDLSSGPSETVF